jgi:hypothetical protein
MLYTIYEIAYFNILVKFKIPYKNLKMLPCFWKPKRKQRYLEIKITIVKPSNTKEKEKRTKNKKKN